jgi:hypothetical protein
MAFATNQLKRPAEVRDYAERALQVNLWLCQCSHLLAVAYAQEGVRQQAGAAS